MITIETSYWVAYSTLLYDFDGIMKGTQFTS